MPLWLSEDYTAPLQLEETYEETCQSLRIRQFDSVARCDIHTGEWSQMPREAIDVELTPLERSLLLRYGYPFARIEHALNSCAGSKAIETVPMDRFELEKLIGDLCRSINDMRGGKLQNQLLSLCERLEAAERYGEGMLDTF